MNIVIYRTHFVKMRTDQVNLDEGWVRVIGKGGKERIVPFGSKAKKSLVQLVWQLVSLIFLASDVFRASQYVQLCIKRYVSIV